LTALERALRIRHGYAEARNNLGAVLMKLGRFDEAQACFESAVALKPQYTMARHNLGSVLRKNGRLTEA
jgi:Flp pilus assembly protein TadD